MTRKEALAELIAKVEAGEFDATEPAPERFNDFMRLAEDVLPLNVLFLQGKAWRAFHGSLDAAKALHEAVLPGWEYNVAMEFAHVFPPHDNGDQEASTGEVCANSARAWLLSILRALLAQEASA